MRTQSKKELPRGLRNNNPLNIRIGNVWLGEVANPDDREFEQFVSLEYGLRAGFVLLRRYIRHYHLQTIEDIISRWAPRNENDTRNYISFVAGQIGMCSNTQLRYDNKAKMCELVQAMAQMECGAKLDMKKIEKAYDMA